MTVSPSVTEQEHAAACAAAQAAGRVLAGSTAEVLASAGRDIKAQADLDAESAMMEVLRPLGLPILSEEMGADEGFALDRDGWIIDPLDGTMNFVRGIPIACTCVALWRGGRPVLGAIHEVALHRTWSGGVGRPAEVDGRRCRCGVAETPAEAVLATGFPRGMDFSEASLAAYARRMSSYKKIRMIGSAGLSLAWAAGGLVDLYLEDDIFIWDVAAGLAIVEAAGGAGLFTPPDSTWRTRVVAGASRLARSEWSASGRPTP
ncbi:MAG: inositol monophosphatase family protein [Phycisphaerales bacterium]|jgi:myo-inositol-1(or 4)-monophosphatase|nr:inositol monophosphatase family protein [Phycisphaerales bacterium]